ncbi:MAG: FHA domain-containing protein [Cyanobacteria bacterium J06597_1]
MSDTIDQIEQLFDEQSGATVINRATTPSRAGAAAVLDDETSISDIELLETTTFVLGIHDGQKPRGYMLDAGMYSIGRSSSNAIAIPNRFVSRRHAYLIRVPVPDHPGTFTYCLVDGNRKGGNSTNGVLVNGQRVGTHYLASGDVIHFGPEVSGYFFSVTAAQSLESQAKAFK